MTKGKPWPTDDEKQLKDWVKSGITIDVLVFSFDGRYSKNAIYQKMIDLKLKEEYPQRHTSSSLNLELPHELPSIEEALKKLTAAINALEQPGLDQVEILRMRSLITGVKTYKELFADYLDYRGLENDLLEMRKKIAELSQKTPRNALA